jgi:tRNA(Ile)-lysidine synthase
MASSKKLPANSSLEHQLKAFLVDVFLSQKRINPKLVLAFSGGLDSTVLLHLLAECNKTLPFQLSAHHVNHSLSKNADAWAEFCADICKKLNVPFAASKVKFNKNSNLGVEAAAREARYNALLRTDAQFICLAHHQDDQAETLLLQLARGAGVKGLAGMAAVSDKLLRPLLDAPRSALEAYAKTHKITWIDDESNADTKFDRNFMRHEVLPILEKSYPSIRQTLSRSAQHFASANELLDELAQIDILQTDLQPQGLSPQNIPAEAGYSCVKPSIHVPLSLAHLSTLSENRANNCLRWWLAQNGLQMPSQAQLQQITQQLLHAKSDANIDIKVSENLTLKRYQNHAYLVPNMQASMPPNPPINWLWRGEDEMILPNKTKLIFSKKMGEGICLRKIENAKLCIQFREGSERFTPQLGRPSRSLKVMLQNHEMPPWQREQLPLIFMDETLVIIPNVGVDAGLQAGSDELGLVVSWLFE